MRTPVRPNPIGLSVARLIRVEGRIVIIDKIDVMDRTPVLDIKPYTPGWDMIPAAISSHRYSGRQYSRDELLVSLRQDAEHALGSVYAQNERVDAAIEALQRLVIDFEKDLRAIDLKFSLPALDGVIDLLSTACGASFGNERIRYEPNLPSDTVFDVFVGGDWRLRFFKTSTGKIIAERVGVSGSSFEPES